MLWLIFLLLIAHSHAEIVFPNQISNDMILQRQPLEAWVNGKSKGCPVGTVISVELKNVVTGKIVSKKLTDSDAQFMWESNLGRLAKSTDPHTLTVSDCSSSKQITGILIGEVILCAGQSNIYWTLNHEAHVNGPTDVLAIIDERRSEFPYMRIYTHVRVMPNSWLDTTNEQFELLTNNCGSQTIKWTTYDPSCNNVHSALCLGTLMRLTDLYREKGITMPVGAVNVGRSGATMSSLTPGDDEARDDQTCGGSGLDYFKIPWGQGLPDSDPKQSDVRSYGTYWNKLFMPLKRMTFRHLVFMQGEIERRMDHVEKPPIPRYSCTQAIFANAIRERLNNPNIKIVTTGINGNMFVNDFNTQWNREAASTILSLPNTGYTTAADHNNFKDKGSIHPPYKWDVARRHALSIMRGIGDFRVNDIGPVSTKELTIETDGQKQYLRIGFDPMTTYNMVMKPTRHCTKCCTDSSPFYYESNNDGIFHAVPINLIILDVSSVYIELDRPVSEITGVAMHFEEGPQCFLYSDWGCEAGELPGVLFRISGITSIPNGNTPPGTTPQPGDPNACPQHGFPPPTPSPTFNPTISPTPPPAPTPPTPPTRRPTPQPTQRPTVPPGTTLFTTVSEGLSSAPFNVHCSNGHTSMVNKQKLTTSQGIGGRQYTWALDADGKYNSVSSDPTNPNNWNTDQNVNALLPDGQRNTISLGSSTNNLAECQTRCEQYAQCNTLLWSELTGRCIMLTHCTAIPLTESYGNEIVQVRKSFGDGTGFHANVVEVNMKCTGTPRDGPSRLGISTRPITVQECYDHCQPILGVTHFTINGELQCSCYTGCDKDNDDTTIVYEIHPADRNTLAPTFFPTNSPTTPAPTETPTSRPTSRPTGSPTKFPTRTPTNFPTGSPSLRPTGAPTQMSADQRFFYDFVREPGAVGGTFVVLIIIILLLI